MGWTDENAWKKECERNADAPKKEYDTIDEFIEWINKADIKEVETLLRRYGFEFTM